MCFFGIRRGVALSCLVLVLGACAAPVESAAVLSSLSLREAFRRALEANKEIRVSEHGVEVSRGRAQAAHGPFDVVAFAEGRHLSNRSPNALDPVDTSDLTEQQIRGGVRKRFVTGTEVELAAATERNKIGDADAALDEYYTPSLSVTLTQDLLDGWGVNVNRTDILVARDRRRIAEQVLRETVIEVLYGVERAYWDLYYAKEDLTVRQAQLGRARKLVARAESQVRVGEAAPIEVTRARASAAQQEVSILNAEKEISRLRHRLLRLLGVFEAPAPEAPLRLEDAPRPVEASPTFLESMKAARDYRPELARARLGVRIAEYEERFARNRRLPTLQLYGSYVVRGLDERFGTSFKRFGGDDRSWEMGLVLEQPLPNRRARGNLYAAAAEVDRAETALAAARERVARDLADALEELRVARGRVDRSREARALAAELLTAEEKSFTLGRSDSLDVLTAQQALATAERDEARATVDLMLAYADLLRLRGDLPEERGIEIAAEANGDPGLL